MLDWWPAIVRPLVEQYGGEAVQREGLAALGYPPAWVHTHAEVAAIRERLSCDGVVME